jgi:acyl-coenzyme A thioesterase PaaI-like protein
MGPAGDPGTRSNAWEDDGYCYLCGRNNPEGLKLSFVLEGTRISTSFTAERRHQGYRGVLHGGFLAMAMDEVMVHLPWQLFGRTNVTAELVVRLLKPAPVGSRITVSAVFGRPASAEDRLWHVDAECALDDGTVVARCSGKCVPVE